MGNALARRHKSDKIYSSGNSDSSCNSSLSEFTSTNIKLIGGRPFIDDEASVYILPTDWEEADRIQLEHFAMKHAFDGNYAAPLSEIIKPGSKILDIGCGSGHWSFEIAQEFPDANVYGIDISPNFPVSIKPKNCNFQICNIVEGLPFKDEEFDYVFMRYMVFALKQHQWSQILNEIKRVLKQGGIFECVDRDILPLSAGKTITAFAEKTEDILFKQKEIDVRFIIKVEPILKEMGFQNVSCTRKHIPYGKWGGKIGEIWRLNSIKMAETFRLQMPEILGITVEEWDSVCAKINKERDENKECDVHYIILATKDKNNNIIARKKI
ncbi:9721_t:CDS:2 [Scutellospora calospora]|uniref:9721_t:CDS:1 n=1 Tax=Scutellospora calospora TaxID=85575 RepID=A0ACA9JWD8_9GLOM|nr:9721_t:CDS:2 [Scutellospora calospora]